MKLKQISRDSMMMISQKVVIYKHYFFLIKIIILIPYISIFLPSRLLSKSKECLQTPLFTESYFFIYKNKNQNQIFSYSNVNFYFLQNLLKYIFENKMNSFSPIQSNSFHQMLCFFPIQNYY